jgi:hypothetical protein
MKTAIAVLAAASLAVLGYARKATESAPVLPPTDLAAKTTLLATPASGPTVDSVVLHRSVQKPAVFRASGTATVARNSFATGTRLNPESYKELRARLIKVAKVFKRDTATFSNTLILADAMAAATPEEYRANIARLPVKVVVADDGMRRDYYVRGRLKMTLFTSAPLERDGGPSAGAFDCEYYDEENNWWDGECATQQEIDDAAAAAASADWDMEQAWNDCMAETDNSEYCGNWQPPQEPASALSIEEAVGGPFDPGILGATPCTDDTVSPSGEVVAGNCVTDGVEAIVAMGSWLSARIGINHIVARGTAAAAAEVGAGVAGVILGAIGGGLALGIFINCMVQ